MNVGLRASWADMAQYIQSAGDARAILRLLNFFPGQGDWIFRFTSNGDETTVSIFVQPLSVWCPDPEVILSGIVPEVFNCSEIEIKIGARSYRALGIDALLSESNYGTELQLVEEAQGDSSNPVLILRRFWGRQLPPSLSDPDSVKAAARTLTWLGSPRFSTVTRTVSWNSLS